MNSKFYKYLNEITRYMKRRTLFDVKRDGEVPTDGIYIKNTEEENVSNNPMIRFHQEAEERVMEILKDLNLGKNYESSTAIDLVGYDGEKTIYIEVERDNATRKWTTTTNFPYPLINIPIEKRRHFKKYRNDSFYLKFNKTMEELFIIYGEDILKYSKQENLLANHNGTRAYRTFLRIKKDYAKFSNVNNTKEILIFIYNKLSNI